MLEVEEERLETDNDKASLEIGECIWTKKVMGGLTSKAAAASVDAPSSVTVVTPACPANNIDSQVAWQGHAKTPLQDLTEQPGVSNATSTRWQSADKERPLENKTLSNRESYLELGSALSTTRADLLDCPYALPDGKQVTTKNIERQVIAQNVCPVSSVMCHSTSNAETVSQQGIGEKVCKETDSSQKRDASGGLVVQQSSKSHEDEMVLKPAITESDSTVSASLFNPVMHDLGKANPTPKKCTSKKSQVKCQMEDVPAIIHHTTEEKDTGREVHVSQIESEQTIKNRITEQVDIIRSIEPEVTIQKKRGRPPKKAKINTEHSSQQLDHIQSMDCDHITSEHITEGTSNQSIKQNCAIKTKSGVSNEAISTEAALTECPNVTETSVIESKNFHDGLPQADGLEESPHSKTQILKPKKKVGRPRKVTNFVVEGSTDASVPHSSNSEKKPMRVSNSVPEVPSETKTTVEKIERASPISSKTNCKEKKVKKNCNQKCITRLFSQELKYTDMNILDKMTSLQIPHNEYEVQHNSQESQNKDECVKEKLDILKEETFGTSVDRDPMNAGNQSGDASVKLKRKVGRPPKKKTLIKMAQQLTLAQKTSSANENSARPHSDPARQSFAKRKVKGLGLQSQVTELRRYSRACKADDIIQNVDCNTKDNRQPVKCTSSDMTAPPLKSDNLMSTSLTAVLSESHNAANPQPRKRGRRPKKRKLKGLDIKSVEGSQEVSNMQNYLASHEKLPQEASSRPNHISNNLKCVHAHAVIGSEQTPVSVSESPHQLTQDAAPSTAVLCVKVPRKRGRPCKNKAPVVKSEAVRKESGDCNSLVESNHTKTPVKDELCAISSDVPSIKPRKIDRRRKKFRTIKAEEFDRLLTVGKPSATIGLVNTAIMDSERVHSTSQSTVCDVQSLSRTSPDSANTFTGMDELTPLAPQGGTNTFKKPYPHTVGPRKRRRRKGSWWKDKRKLQGISIKRNPDTTTEPSREDHAQMSLSKDFDIEKERKGDCVESIDAYQHAFRDSQEPQALPFTGHVQDHEDIPGKSLELDGGPQCEDQGNPVDDISIQRKIDLSKVVEKTLETMNVRAQSISCKTMRDEGTAKAVTEMKEVRMETEDPESSNVAMKIENDPCEVKSPKSGPVQEVETRLKHVVSIEQSNRSPELEDDPNSEDSNAESATESECKSSKSPGRPRKLNKPIACEYCERLFNHHSAYVIHRRVHTGEKPYTCQDCGKAFAQLSNLKSHSRVHGGPTKLPCQYCNMKFFTQKELSSHCRTHSEYRKQRSTTGSIEHGHGSDFVSSFQNKGKHQACHVCGKGFRFRSMLKIHMRVHSGEKPYSCRVCGKAFSQACSVRVHERIHWSVKPYLCRKCGKGFSQIGTLKSHTCKVSGDSHSTVKEMLLKSAVTFRCHLCKKCFHNRHEYELHLQTHSDSECYGCDMCGQQFGLFSELNAHRRYCNKMKLADIKQDHPEPVQNSQLQSFQHPQSTSPTFIPIKSQSQEHEHQKKPSTPAPAHRRNTIQPHKSKMHPSLLTCPSKVMATSVYHPQNNFKPHQPSSITSLASKLNSLDQKSDPRKYLCPRCGRLFRHVGRLRAHILTHAQGQSYTCGRCGRMLENWSKFWRHQRVHRQKRGRFFCPRCGKGFRFAGLYREHLQEHPELNAYFCPLCPHTFSNAEGLRAHQQDWHSSSMPNICEICGKGFASRLTLERHGVAHRRTPKEKHSGETLQKVELPSRVLPYQCGECASSFKTLDLLFRHQLCHSSAKDEPTWNSGPTAGHSLKRSQDFHPNSDNPHPSTFTPHLNSRKTYLPTGFNHDRSPSSQFSGQTKANPPHFFPTSNYANLPQTPPLTTPLPLHDAQQCQETSTSAPRPASVPPSLRSHPQSSPSPHIFKKPHTYEKTMNYSLEKITPRDPPSPVTVPVELGTEGLECAECGARFTAVPALYQHYFQHARGEV